MVRESEQDAHIVAIDGGGTGCRVRLADDAGRMLATAQGGPANVCTDFEAARRNILAAVTQAYEDAGLEVEDRRRDVAWAGLAGAGVGDLAQAMEAALGFGRVRVTTDTETTVEGALGAADGTVALLGTGSFFVRRENGRDRRIGGWGYQLGDEAGGAWLGRELLRATLHAYDGLRPHSPLSRKILAEYGESPDQIALFGQKAGPGEIAMLAPRVADAQGRGDALAQEIMDRAVEMICTRLDVLGAEASGALCLLGGLAAVYAPLLPDRYRRLFTAPRGNALDGGLALARRNLAQGGNGAGEAGSGRA